MVYLVQHSFPGSIKRACVSVNPQTLFFLFNSVSDDMSKHLDQNVQLSTINGLC